MLVGCNKVSESDVVEKYSKLLDKTNAYSLKADMDIVSNEDMYHYDVCVDYKEGDYYKVTLVNKDNDHTQIILKNDTGVYVMTQKSTKQKLNIV